MNLKDFLVNSARLFPQKTALIYRDRRLSYSELYSNACRCASALRKLGIGKGECVCIAARNCVEYLEIIFGCSMIAAIPCLINWRLSSEVTADMADEAGAKVLFLSNTEKDKADYLRENCGGKGLRIISILEDPQAPADYDSFRGTGSPEVDFEEALDGDTGMILFTSGTTGRAKGVLISNKALITQVYNTVVCARWSHDERFMCVSPICHSISLSVMACFCVSGTLILCPLECLRNCGRLLKVMEEEYATRVTLVPTVIERLVSYAEVHGISDHTLRIISYGASPMNTSLMKRCQKIFDCKFHQGYGMTETYGTVTALLPEDHQQERFLGSVGRPMVGVSLRIVDDKGKEVPAGRIGEIVIKAETLMKGYLGMPELTKQVIVDGWYHSGDIGYMSEEGYLYLTDRKSSMIITGGENVFPAEIEKCIMTMYPEVREVSVAGVPDPVWGEIIVAAVVKKPGSQISDKDIMEHCRKHLGSFKKPKKIVFLDALPLTGSGKVSREKIKELFK